MVILSSVSCRRCSGRTSRLSYVERLLNVPLIAANHRTGETCTLTFKPRGWRGKDAFEIKGSVLDSAGRTAWDIAGRTSARILCFVTSG